MKNSKYDNILNAPPWEPRSHPRMPISKRAAQFQPFDPLEGYDEAVNETARETDAERYLDETTVASLNATLAELNARIKEQPAVTVTYFVPDMKKTGGAYQTQASGGDRLCGGSPGGVQNGEKRPRGPRPALSP